MWKKNPFISKRKAHQILKLSYRWYSKKWSTLPKSELSWFESQMAQLDEALKKNNQIEWDKHAREIEQFGKIRFRKTPFQQGKELILAILFAVVIAIFVRQIWFEPYEIPTGSMRPTFEEKDHILVSKTTFGINFPLRTKHLYFDPSLVQRSSIFIFSGADIPLIDSDTTYLGIFPYKKRFIKRCMGKPGDTVYFYGGKIYAIDKDGKDIPELRNAPWLDRLEYLPFHTFEGRLTVAPMPQEDSYQVILHQINQPIGRLIVTRRGAVTGEIFDGNSWIKENLSEKGNRLQSYSDFIGIKNFAMARILTKNQVKELDSIDISQIEDAPLYLELRHHPNLTHPKPRFVLESHNRMEVLLTPFVTVIPLQKRHMDALMDSMYTARFNVAHGFAKRYSVENYPFTPYSPHFPGVPDGTYEFYYGKGKEIGWAGISWALPKDSPLYSRTPENLQKLFNLGIEFSTQFEPFSPHQAQYPSRYAYFREGDLYILGAPIFKKEDPTLISFNRWEQQRQKEATKEKPYIAFKDYGPPIKDGKIDVEFINTFGFTLPEKHYLALGDNHAMSSDSRYFGPVPQDNLQGTPSLILWPPDSWGIPPQKPYPWLTLPTVIVWGFFILIALVWYYLYRKSLSKPVYEKLSLT